MVLVTCDPSVNPSSDTHGAEISDENEESDFFRLGYINVMSDSVADIIQGETKMPDVQRHIFRSTAGYSHTNGLVAGWVESNQNGPTRINHASTNLTISKARLRCLTCNVIYFTAWLGISMPTICCALNVPG